MDVRVAHVCMGVCVCTVCELCVVFYMFRHFILNHACSVSFFLLLLFFMCTDPLFSEVAPLYIAFQFDGFICFRFYIIDSFYMVAGTHACVTMSLVISEPE